MPSLDALRQRKIGRWTVGYVAIAWGTLQLLDFLASHFGWPGWIVRAATVFLIVNVLTVIILAWYHGERGPQRVTPLEALLLAVTLIGATGGGWLAAHSKSDLYATSSARELSESSVAVLPFRNLGSADNAYLSDGITEEILDAVAKIPGLRVAARTSSFAFRDASADQRGVAQKLGVAHLLTGTVQRVGDRVRVNTQLDNIAQNSTVWSEKYDSDAKDLFALEDSISKSVAQTLRKTFAARNAGNSDVSESAHMLYLLGLNRWSKRTVPSIHEAIAYFKQAVDSAPSYAQAHSGMALALAVLPNYDTKALSDTVFPRAEKEARLALRLDSTSDEAWAALSQIYQYQDRMREAELYGRKAIALNDNNATAHQWLAEVLHQTGRSNEAVAEMSRAVAIDPLSPVIIADRARALAATGNFDAALKDDRAGLAMDSLFNLGGVLIDAVEAKQWDLAHLMLVRLTSPDRKDWTADTVIDGLRNPAARPALMRLLHAPAPGHEPTIAWLAEKIGDRDLAISLARAADRAGVPSFAFWTPMALPSMKGLREDPRFPARFRWPRK